MTSRKAIRRSVPPEELPSFTAVPRKVARHDGWTPERQIAFVAALADTGCVAIAARMVNMSADGAYQLRRQPGAESFRRAWEAAQTLGLLPVKDEAFHRAMHGQLVPVFVGGKLMGFRRKKNDRLLMFILRHYGQDAQGRKTTVNYFSTRATAGAAAPSGRQPTRSGALTSARDAGSGRPTTGEAVSIDVTDSLRDDAFSLAGASSSHSSPGFPGDEQARHAPGMAAGCRGQSAPAHDRAKRGGGALAAAEASTTTLRTIVSGPAGARSQLAADDQAADILNNFEGVELDEEAQAEIYRALAACAERRRALENDPENDPERFFIGQAETNGYLGELESGVEGDWVEFRPEGEHYWEGLGEGGEAEKIDEVLRGMEERKALSSPAHPEALEGPAHPEAPEEPLPLILSQPAPDPGAGEDPRPRKPYKKRQPKPPFTPPEPALAKAWEARKAEAVAAVTAKRRELAAAEAKRRKARARRD